MAEESDPTATAADKARTRSDHRRTGDDADQYDDVERWADRERRRREAWLAGPSEDEKLDWARRERHKRRRSGGYGPSSGLGPSDEEVTEWAERERRRREAWLAGPTEREKAVWARRQRVRQRSSYADPYDDGYADDFYLGSGPYDPYDPDFEAGDEADRQTMRRLRRDMELARIGAMSHLIDFPVWWRSRLIRAGRDWEDEFSRPVRRRRISKYD